MRSEELVSEVLAERAEQCRVPAPEIGSLLARGRAARQRQRRVRATIVAGTVLAAVLSVGAVVAARLVGPEAAAPAGRPAPSEPPTLAVRDLPVGEPPSIPYCSSGSRITVGDESFPSSCGTLVHRGDRTIGFDRDAVFTIDHRGPHLLSRRPADTWLPVMDAEGRYAAWSTTGDPWSRLVVYDVASRELLVDEAVFAPRFWVPGIDENHRVYIVTFDSPGQLMAYDLDSGTMTDVEGTPTWIYDPAVTYVTEDGVAFRTEEFWETGETTSRSDEGVVTGDGSFESTGEVPVGWSYRSPDGSRLVQETDDGFWVQPVDDLDQHVRLQLPTNGRVLSSPVWETDDTLLASFDPVATPGSTLANGDGFAAPSSRLWLLRCSATTGECETALRPGHTDGQGSLYR